MPIWLMSAVRTAIQAGWGYAAAWLLAHGVDVPADVPAWVLGGGLALASGVVTAGIRWLETRPWPWARTVGRWLMLGIRRQPVAYATRITSPAG